jgi:hypothetical protein
VQRTGRGVVGELAYGMGDAGSVEVAAAHYLGGSAEPIGDAFSGSCVGFEAREG